ncbi:helix-turn-helix transcriptional regulator [Pseudoflavonifractor sp. AF19-9AC]|uniref:helix-turn-helix domain-containing protein n=1 Tax=Pseudoflavonifractor sp. AF19-9AC TaxID=2292244 RepID=UPI001FA98BDF|nr:helix-turn-helix transcriptional regulator [Pseudoflavonifractor sp. AF19-9AC]
MSLRTQLGLSQEDLAEKLGVSRQSVSKWETGQSVPDLDKLIKLADLFGISVDELVREGERPKPPEPPQPQVVYVKEKRSLTGTQTAGVCLELIGLALDLLGLVGESNLLVFLGTALIVLGLPLLLAARHPLLIFGWLAVALSLVIFNPYTMAYMPWGLLGGIQLLVMCILSPEEWYVSTQLGILISITRGVLILWLIYGSFHAWNKGRKPT